MNKAIIDFTRLTDAETAQKALIVLIGMGANPFYTTAKIIALVTALQNAQDIYSAALNISVTGGKAEKTAKDTAKKAVIDALRAVCNEVNYETPEDRDKISTTNLTLSPEFPVTRQMNTLKKFTLEQGENHGSVVAKASKGKGTLVVVMEKAIADTIDGDTQWTLCPVAKSTCVISGLPIGKKVWVRPTSLGSRDQVLVGDPLSIIVN
jgi:hypothetical protein